jgi:sugar (pentulose or hexulose) kinase
LLTTPIHVPVAAEQLAENEQLRDRLRALQESRDLLGTASSAAATAAGIAPGGVDLPANGVGGGLRRGGGALRVVSGWGTLATRVCSEPPPTAADTAS